MAEPEFHKSYISKLHPNKRKHAYLDATLSYLDKGTKDFFELLLALYGGIKPEMLRNVEDVDPDLICASCWFKIVPKKDFEKFQIPQPLVLKRFTKYLGANPSDKSLEYIQGNFDVSTHAWIDCREQHLALVEKIKVDANDLAIDLTTLFREGMLPLTKNATHQPSASISKMFGPAEKEDRGVKTKVCKEIFYVVENEGVATLEKLKQVILKSLNAKSTSEFHKKYAGNGNGRHCFLVKALQKKDEFDYKWRKNFLKQCKEVFTGKAEPIKWRCMKTIAASLNFPFHQSSWSEMFKNAIVDIVTKNSRNYTYAEQQFSDRSALSAMENGAANAIVLNDFFKSPFFTAEDEFVISPQHVGGRNLEQLFKVLEKGEVTEDEAISDYMSEIKASLTKNPVYSLLKYVVSIRDKMSFTDILNGASYNAKQNKINRQKVHPTVIGNQGYTWGVSALKGKITAPKDAERSMNHATPDTKIWLTISLLDHNRQWVDHHVPFFNARFFEEVYAYNPDPNAGSIKYRNTRYGYVPNNGPLNQDEIKAIQNAPDNLRDVNKRVCRVQANIRTGNLPNAEWNKQAIKIKKLKNGEFEVTVIMKSPYKKPKTGPAQIGERILSFDQGQTASHSYGIISVVGKDHPGAIYFRNMWLVPDSSGDIYSSVDANGTQYDQLSYQGITHEKFKDWRKAAREFVKQYQFSSILNKKGERVNYLEAFDKMAAWQNPLYQFNAHYAKTICTIMKGKTKEEIQKIRHEIIRFSTAQFSTFRLSSLSSSSYDALNKNIGLINAYFSNMLKVSGQKVQRYIDDDKLAIDPKMFEILETLRLLKRNKNKEKIKRNANSLMQIAIKNKVTRNVGEGKLPVADKKSKKKQNVRSMDWLARGLATKLAEFSPMHNIAMLLTDPQYTSHQDPFVHRSQFDDPQPAMRARFTQMPIENIGDWVMNKLSIYLKNTTVGGTATYYHQGALDFLANYGLEEYRDAIKNKKMPCWELQKILIERLGNKNEIVYIPMRGGRVYLSTYKVTTIATPIVYNGKKLWASNADQVAAFNISLSNTYLFPLAKKASEDVTQ